MSKQPLTATLQIVHTKDGRSAIQSIPNVLLSTIFLGVFHSEVQEFDKPEEKPFHLAADDADGPVAYMQVIDKGGFTVTFGDPSNPSSMNFQEGNIVVFQDNEGEGHGSKINEGGCTRTFFKRRGHFQMP